MLPTGPANLMTLRNFDGIAGKFNIVGICISGNGLLNYIIINLLVPASFSK
jgi:hypothetical protein